MTVEGFDTYRLPSDFMAPISIIYDGKSIDIKGIEWAMTSDEDSVCVFIDNSNIVIAPCPIKAVSFVLNYHASRRIDSASDVLSVGDEYVDTVLYYALSLAHQKQASEESLAQSRFYLSLFKDQVSDVQDIALKRRSSHAVQSRFQRV